MKYIARFVHSIQVTEDSYQVVSTLFECTSDTTVGQIMDSFKTRTRLGGYIRCELEDVNSIETPQEIKKP